MGSGMIVVSGQYLSEVARIQSPQTCSTLACMAAPTVNLGGYALLFFGGAEMLFGFLIRGGYLSAKRQKVSLELGSGPESEQILHIANESLARFTFNVRRIGLGQLPWHQGVRTLAWQ